MPKLTAKTLEGETIEFDLEHFAFVRGQYLVEDTLLGIVQIDPDTIRCYGDQQIEIAQEALTVLQSINEWFGEHPEAAPNEPPWAKDFYALMEKLGEA